MRRTSIVTASLTVLLLLTGCTTTPTGTASTSSSAVSPTASASSNVSVSASNASAPPTAAFPSGGASSPTARYAEAVQQLSPTLRTTSPATLVRLGQAVCADFKQGKSVNQIAELLGREAKIRDFSGADAAVVIGAAVPTLCPQYRSRLQ